MHPQNPFLAETGNLYIETYQFSKPDMSDKRPSGINISKADFWAFATPNETGFIIIKAEVGEIDTVPPESVAENARRALDVRAEKPESQRGMTAVGIARARDLANRTALSEDTIRRMVAYFERHQSDKQGESWDEQGKGWQAWNGWGGDEGWSWARGIVERLDKERGS